MSASVKSSTDDGTIAIFQTVHQDMAVPATPVVTGGSSSLQYEKMGPRSAHTFVPRLVIVVFWQKHQGDTCGSRKCEVKISIWNRNQSGDFWEIQLFFRETNEFMEFSTQ